MSWQAAEWVANLRNCHPTGKLVLFAIAKYASDSGCCWPSEKTIAQAAGLSERSVREWKGKLAAHGLLSVRRRRGAGGMWSSDEIQLAMDPEAIKKLQGVQVGPEDGEPLEPVPCDESGDPDERLGEPSADRASSAHDSRKSPRDQRQLTTPPPARPAGGKGKATGSSRHRQRQLTAQPPADGAVPPVPPYKEEPSEETSLETSLESSQPIERETDRSKDREEADAEFFDRVFNAWPTSFCDSRSEAWEAWQNLSFAEKDLAAAAAERYQASVKALGRKHICGYPTYLREKRWRQLPAKSARLADRIEARPFDPLWGAARMRALVCDPPVPAPPPRAGSFIAKLLAQNDAAAETQRRERQATYGWPHVRAMDEAAQNRKSTYVPDRLAALRALMEPVEVGSPCWDAWHAEHERRGWPWLPAPDVAVRFVCFPIGGPAGLATFETAVRNHSPPPAAETRSEASDGTSVTPAKAAQPCTNPNAARPLTVR